MRYKRWIEILFYTICADLLSLNNSMLDVMAIIESIAQLSKLNTEQCKVLAQEVLTSTRYRPDKYELIILGAEFGVHKESLKKRLKICNRDFYNIINKDKNDPRPVYPKMLDAQYSVAEIFVKTYYKIKGVGLQC
jgi:hypothetical protein